MASQPQYNPASAPTPSENIHQQQQSAFNDNNDGNIQQTHQPLPPSYDQAKNGQSQQQQQHANAGLGPPTVIPLQQLADQPQWIDCPFCHRRSTTIVQRDGTSMQIVAGVALCLLCVCLACVPCLAGWFEDTEYRCSSCKNMVARRHHDGPIEVFGPVIPVYSQYAGNQAPVDQHQHQQQQQQQQQQHPQQYEMNTLQPQIQHQDPTPPPPVKQ